MAALLFGGLSLLPAYLICWFIYTRYFHPLSQVPGPFWASITRLWMTYHASKGDTDFVQRDLHRKFGPLVRIAPGEVSCADPENIRSIYRIQGPLLKTDFYPIWGNKTFSKHLDQFTAIDEKVHRTRRRIVNNVYSMSTVLTLELYIDKCSTLFIERMSDLAKQNKTVDLGEWLQWYAFDVIGELFFGRMFGFMEKSSDHESYIASMDCLLPVLATAAVASPLVRFLILGSSFASRTTRKALKAFEQIVVAAKACVKQRLTAANDNGKPARADLMQHLLDIVSSKGEKVDFRIGDVEQEAYIALFAGSDTTAIALRAVFYYLAKHPQAYTELEQEIDLAFENHTLSDPPRYAEAQQVPLLRATIKEAMRLHPSVGMTMPRIVGAEGLQLAGLYIPPGYWVGMNAAVVGRDRKIYGDDADEFRPGRWLEGDEAMMDRYSLVFGAGTRTCLGKNISLCELYKLVPLVLRKLKVELENPEKEWTTGDFWFNKQSGIHVKLQVK